MNFAQRRQLELAEAYEMGCRVGWQRHSDAVSVVLRDAEIVGKPVAKDRILAVMRAAQDYDYKHIKAFAVRGKESGEAAYQQELRDRDMREVYGEKAVSFADRYPEIKEIKW